jgi:hypothetical protein
MIYDQKCISVFMYSANYSCHIVMKLEFSRQFFERSSNTKFNEKPSSVEPSCFMRTDGRTEGQTERHDEADSPFLKFCEST